MRDVRLLLAKIQDEVKALQLCQSKVRQKKLPMEVIDAEYQWCVAFFASFLYVLTILLVLQGPTQVNFLLRR